MVEDLGTDAIKPPLPGLRQLGDVLQQTLVDDDVFSVGNVGRLLVEVVDDVLEMAWVLFCELNLPLRLQRLCLLVVAFRDPVPDERLLQNVDWIVDVVFVHVRSGLDRFQRLPGIILE